MGQICPEAFSLVQDLDERILDEAAPCFMVLGKTSAGKSTLLQRLTRLPFHPSGAQICTRVAVKVELRPGFGDPKAAIAVYRFDEVKGTFVAVGRVKAISMEADSQDVQQEMNALLETEGLSKTAAVGASGTSQVITTKELRIRVTSPTLPVLDVLDLPGMLLDGSATGRATKQLFKRYTLSSGHRSIFICAVDGSSPQVEWSVERLLGKDDEELAQMQLNTRSLGVFTKCDRIDEDEDTTILQDYLRHNHAPLRHGYLAVAGKVNATTDRERHEFARRFGVPKWDDVPKDLQDRTSITAFQKKVHDLYLDQVHNEWIPKTVEKLLQKWIQVCKTPTRHSKSMQGLCDEVVLVLLDKYRNFHGSELVLKDMTLGPAEHLQDGLEGPCKTLIKEWLEVRLSASSFHRRCCILYIQRRLRQS
eukprot:Skav200629  [mRNA]  locus=scaffold353:17600:18859:+ [translate_table: standard]